MTAGRRFARALGDLAAVVRAVFSPRPIGGTPPAPDRVATGSSPALEIPCPPGLAPCPHCGRDESPRGDHFAVHYPTISSMKPCKGSWPPPSKGSGP